MKAIALPWTKSMKLKANVPAKRLRVAGKPSFSAGQGQMPLRAGARYRFRPLVSGA